MLNFIPFNHDQNIFLAINFQDQLQPASFEHSDYGKKVYSHRMSVVGQVFSNIGTNKKLNRFSLRGKTKVQAQWRLLCVVQNIGKLANYGQLAA